MSLPPGFTGVSETGAWRSLHDGHDIGVLAEPIADDGVIAARRYWLHCRTCNVAHLVRVEHVG